MSNRIGPNYMSRADRALRHERVLQMLEENSPSRVAEVFGLTTDHVRQIALNAGHRPPQGEEARVHSMWEMDEDARRRAVILRAAKGARKTLTGENA